LFIDPDFENSGEFLAGKNIWFKVSKSESLFMKQLFVSGSFLFDLLFLIN